MLLVGSQKGFAAFTADGEIIGVKGLSGEAVDALDYVSAITLGTDDNAYVIDSYNNRFLKYNRDGDLIYEVKTGAPGNKGVISARSMTREELVALYPGAMQLPKGIALDGAGRVLIIDMFDFTIAAFDAETGEYIEKYGQEGIADGQFMYPNDIAYDSRQNIFASAEANVGRVQLFGIDGSSANPLSGLRRQWGDLLSACCYPLLILLLILAIYLITKALAKRHRDTEALYDVEEEVVILIESDNESSPLRE
jgi:hypothetical protein